MGDGKIDMSKVNAIAFDPYTHGYYKVNERVSEAFRDGLKLKKVRYAEKELSHKRRLLLKISQILSCQTAFVVSLCGIFTHC